VRAALIGFGSIGKRHARCLAQKFEELAIIDVDPPAREAAKSQFPKAHVLSSLTELWRLNWPWQEVLVVIATWGPSHYELFRECAEQGVRRILCEKPLAGSLYEGWRMVVEAGELGITLGVNHTLRFLGVDRGVKKLAQQHSLGPPHSVVVHGGASGLVTNGIHFIDLAMSVIGASPVSVVSTAAGEAINPRSPGLLFFGGSAVWTFPAGEEAVVSLHNRSSIYPTATLYYRDGAIYLHDRTMAVVLGRSGGPLPPDLPVTRTAPVGERLYEGPVPGVLDSMEEAFLRHYDEVAAGRLESFSPGDAYRALEACLGALIAAECGQRIRLPIDPQSEWGRRRWPVS
jgi:Predicted dehydrogenases and related proteins